MSKKGNPPLEENELAVRINVSLPLSLAQELRRRVPAKERSAFIVQLIRDQFSQESQAGDTTKPR